MRDKRDSPSPLEGEAPSEPETDQQTIEGVSSLTMDALQEYLRECASTHGFGVAETSHYPALKKLIDAAGKELKPHVVCIINPKGSEGNQPDGGLFPANHLPKPGQEGLPFEDTKARKPERGVIEAKGLGQDLEQLIAGEQVKRYLLQYKQVLATNLREFAAIHLRNGQAVVVERYSLAVSESAFLDLAGRPKVAERQHGKPLAEFLKRTLLASVTLSAPAEVAAYLASYAREARHKLDLNAQPLELKQIQDALSEALGVKFEGERGDDFFRSTLVQTLFYGMFSAWVLWHEEPNPDKAPFNWLLTSHYLTIPVIDRLFVGAMSRKVLEQTDLTTTLKSAEEVLNRVDWPAFSEAFEQGLAVQYFYEPFLAAFDPELRKQMGVWYTPPEIVRYMVGRVDQVLREELGEADGLASPNVLVLDPCCGTGAYLVEALRLIAKRYADRGEAVLHGDDIRKAATDRLFGFELLPGPFVVAHLQLGFLLAKLGVHLGPNERSAVYLTNALTGWDPAQDVKQQLDPLSLFAEADAAKEVKRDKPILVVMGNPPYNGYAGTFQMDEELGLVERYVSGKRKGQGLNDLYVRFFAMADRRIEKTGRGVICFISNYSWLDGLSFGEMRRKYLETFDRIWIDNLHGDRIISEYSPDGKTSETIFAVSGQSVGIKVGTAISMLLRRGASIVRRPSAEVLYRDVDEARAEDRRSQLQKALRDPQFTDRYSPLLPNPKLANPFKPRKVGTGYLDWPRLPELMPTGFPGVNTARDSFLVDIDRSSLEARVRAYFDKDCTEQELAKVSPQAVLDTSGYNARTTRATLQARGLDPTGFRNVYYRPFDERWLYYERETKLIDRNRREFEHLIQPGNVLLICSEVQRREYDGPLVCRPLPSYHIIERASLCFPLRCFGASSESSQGLLLPLDGDAEGSVRSVWNLSPLAWEALETSKLNGHPECIFFHSLAILHSPAYAEENAGALRQDWPRVPLPKDRDLLLHGLELGKRLAALLDPESPVPGVNEGDLPAHLQAIAGFDWNKEGAPREGTSDLDLKANWGYKTPQGAVMPATGKVHWQNRPSAQPSLEGAPAGPVTVDVVMNEHARWTGIPEAVWNYTLGGYQVMKKWLSYRERDVLGRPMKLAEVREFSAIARRIACILAMGPELDEHYRASATAATRSEEV